MRHIAVDTGPIVALLNRRDAYHEWALQTFEGLVPPLFTCEPVLAEAMWLVRGSEGGSAAVLDLLIRGVLKVNFQLTSDLMALRTLMAKYASVPMSLADACLVRISELDPDAEIVTLDSDFKIYRRSGRRLIRIISPT